IRAVEESLHQRHARRCFLRHFYLAHTFWRDKYFDGSTFGVQLSRTERTESAAGVETVFAFVTCGHHNRHARLAFSAQGIHQFFQLAVAFVRSQMVAEAQVDDHRAMKRLSRLRNPYNAEVVLGHNLRAVPCFDYDQIGVRSYTRNLVIACSGAPVASRS